MSNSKKKTKITKATEKDRERLEILQRAEEVRGKQLSVGLDGRLHTEDELKNFALGGVESPEKRYELYYPGIRKLLMRYLPEGKENMPLRRIVYDEKNVFLSRGKKLDSRGIRGADGRMGFEIDLDMAFKAVVKWASENGTPVQIYDAFRKLNDTYGYGHQESDATANAFQESEGKKKSKTGVRTKG